MPEKIKVVFMGTPDFAVPPLQALISAENIEVSAVITQEDKKVGRKQIVTPPPVKILALENQIPVLQPPGLKNNAKIVKLLQDLRPDFIVVVAFGRILPETILKIPKYCCINIHGSLLPKYRGASPIEEALRRGDKETGLTFIKMTGEMDAGPVLHIQRLPIDPADTSLTLRVKLSVLASTLLPAVLQDYVDEVITPIPQDESKSTRCHKIIKADGFIDPVKMTANEISNCIRAFTSWPGCFLIIGNKKLKLIEIKTDNNSTNTKSLRPGQISEPASGQIAIGTKSGAIILTKVQLEGKKAMPIQDFLRGNKDLFKEALTSAK
ncbi:methionyl-tRNA formyltransferase [Patescibacteria group bacterium]|nr:methionyl-tRNA formyltransferase [Patescibacteria group bacterium]